jgi:hypothetical protein
MMPKEKAIELVEKFYSKYNNVLKTKGITKEQKRMAIIAVDEVIKEVEEMVSISNYGDVKQEIEKL